MPELDRQAATQRIVDATGLDPRFVGGITDDAIVFQVESDPSSVIQCEYVKDDGSWYVQQMWGQAGSFLPLIKMMLVELVARGQGDTPLRWRNMEDRPIVNRIIRRFLVREVIIGGKAMWELTANEALPLMTQVIV
jgi:hypothetical protein